MKFIKILKPLNKFSGVFTSEVLMKFNDYLKEEYNTPKKMNAFLKGYGIFKLGVILKEILKMIRKQFDKIN